MRLVADDLVVLEDHKGFRVAPVSQEELVDLAMTWFELEALGIRQSIKKGDDRWAANIQARFRELSKHRMRTRAGTSRPRMGAAQPGVSRVAVRRVRIAVADALLPRAFGAVFPVPPALGEALTRKRNIAKEHEDLCRAVLNRNTAAAVAALRKHRTTTIQDLLADWNEA